MQSGCWVRMSSRTSFCIAGYSHQQGTFGYAIQPYLKSANIQIQYIDCLIRIIYQLKYKYNIQDTRQYIVLHHPRDVLPHHFPAFSASPNGNKLTRQHRSPVKLGAKELATSDLIWSGRQKICASWSHVFFTPQNPQMREFVIFIGGGGGSYGCKVLGRIFVDIFSTDFVVLDSFWFSLVNSYKKIGWI